MFAFKEVLPHLASDRLLVATDRKMFVYRHHQAATYIIKTSLRASKSRLQVTDYTTTRRTQPDSSCGLERSVVYCRLLSSKAACSAILISD
jgi:hypothetical protein